MSVNDCFINSAQVMPGAKLAMLEVFLTTNAWECVSV